jgi:hypothetical protein
MRRSDFPMAYVKGLPLWVPLPARRFLKATGAAGISWFPCTEFLRMPEVSDSVEPSGFSRFRTRPYCLPHSLTASALQITLFEAQYSACRCPCSTLRRAPCDALRMTRGQDGSLLLSCVTLSFTTHCRFSPAHQTESPRHVACRGKGESCSRSLFSGKCGLCERRGLCRYLAVSFNSLLANGVSGDTVPVPLSVNT